MTSFCDMKNGAYAETSKQIFPHNIKLPRSKKKSLIWIFLVILGFCLCWWKILTFRRIVPQWTWWSWNFANAIKNRKPNLWMKKRAQGTLPEISDKEKINGDVEGKRKEGERETEGKLYATDLKWREKNQRAVGNFLWIDDWHLLKPKGKLYPVSCSPLFYK